MRATGPVGQVLSGSGAGDLRVRVPEQRRARAALESAGFHVSEQDDALRVHTVGDPAQVTRVLAAQQLYLTELSPVAADLESVFLELTQEGRP